VAQLLVAGTAGLVALWVVRKWRSSKGPERTAKAGAVVTTIGRLLLAVPIVWAVAAMSKGCEDEPTGPSAPVTPDGVGPAAGTGADGGPDAGTDGDDGQPERMTCGSWREEDCPPYPSVLVPGDGTP
jgi:hypothetical protein